ncbi:hypothetical protein NMY22_g19259 [Coprinellus aureogranulatus]|nr:hypothetical protein NMY22_g19259 [Coprinellus aureogranulatus]
MTPFSAQPAQARLSATPWLGTPFRVGENEGNGLQDASSPFDTGSPGSPPGGGDIASSHHHHHWPSPPLPSSEPPYSSEAYVTIPDSWSQTLDSIYGSNRYHHHQQQQQQQRRPLLLLVPVHPLNPRLGPVVIHSGDVPTLFSSGGTPTLFSSGDSTTSSSSSSSASSALPISPSRASSQSGGLAYHLSTPPNLKANLSPEHLLGLLPACPSPRKACGFGGVPQLFSETGIYLPSSPHGILGAPGIQPISLNVDATGGTPISYVVPASSSQAPVVPFRLLFPPPTGTRLDHLSQAQANGGAGQQDVSEQCVAPSELTLLPPYAFQPHLVPTLGLSTLHTTPLAIPAAEPNLANTAAERNFAPPRILQGWAPPTSPSSSITTEVGVDATHISPVHIENQVASHQSLASKIIPGLQPPCPRPSSIRPPGSVPVPTLRFGRTGAPVAIASRTPPQHQPGIRRATRSRRVVGGGEG